MTDPNDDLDLPDGEQPSDEEIAEAEALARALERGVARSVPDAALEAAALLRVSQQPELPEERARALWEELEAGGKFTSGAAEPDGHKRWLWALIPALAAGATLIVLVEERAPLPQLAEGVIPAPPAALLEAQAAYLQSEDPDARALFEERMGEYRAVVLASLEGDPR